MWPEDLILYSLGKDLGTTIWLSALYKAAGSAQMPASEDRVFP